VAFSLRWKKEKILLFLAFSFRNYAAIIVFLTWFQELLESLQTVK